MDEVRAVLQEVEKQLVAIGTLYEADLELQRVSPTLRGKLKGFLGNQRSALDHLAHAVVAAHGSGEAHTHYPFAAEAGAFEASLDKNMPGVREQRPDIADTIARHQPYCVPALARLRDLLNDESQQRLTAETRDKPKDDGTPASADPLDAATVEAPAPAAPAPAVTATSPVPPTNAGGSTLSGGVFIDGVEYDPMTLKRHQEAQRAASTVIYVDWRFAGSDASALSTLEAINEAVRAALEEVAATAGLAIGSD